MKTWTNPSVEELDVKLTSFFYAWWQVEEANGVLDDSLFWGTDNPGNGNGNENGNGDGNGNGSGENEGGFGNAS